MKHCPARCAVMAIACWMLLALAYAGPKDFWEVKSYTDWTAGEVEKILRKNCPWTRVELLLPSEGGGSRSSKGSPNPSYSTPVYVIWNSRIVREALVRKTMLELPDTPKEQLDKALNYQPKHLEIFVNGPVLPGGRGGGQGESVAAFKEKTFLQKKNKERIPLVDLVVAGGRSDSLTLLFAREMGGKPTVAPEDKEVTLVLRIGESNYKFIFNMAKMTVNGKLEI